MVAEPVAKLSQRQRECLALVYERKTSKEIAQLLGIEPQTVDSHIKDAVRLLGVANRREAAELAIAGAPRQLGPQPPLLDLAPVATPATPSSGGLVHIRVGLPLRGKGAIGNELDTGERLAWIIFLAIALAIGFGMLALGLSVLGRIARTVF